MLPYQRRRRQELRNLKITEVSVQTFSYQSNVVQDSEGHGHPGPEHEAKQSMLRIGTDSVAAGFIFGVDPAPIRETVAPILWGEDPLYRERIWQTLRRNQRIYRDRLTDRVLAAVDLALSDLAGAVLEQPVHKLSRVYRDKVPAYASTMCGDDVDGGLNSPEMYGAFASQCKDRGYRAFKLHTWMPPIPGAPNPQRDIARAGRSGRRWVMTCTSCWTPITTTAASRRCILAANSKISGSTGWKSPWTSTARRRTNGCPTSSTFRSSVPKPPRAGCRFALSG